MDDDVISLGQVFRTLRKHLIMIISLGVLGCIVAFGVTKFAMTPQYDSSALILVNQKNNVSQVQQYNQVQTDLQMINTYKDILTQPVILDQAAKDLQADGKYNGTAHDLASALTISNNENSQVVKVTARADSPYIAQDIANAVTTVFKAKITKIMPSAKNVSIISDAKLNKGKVSPRTTINLAVGLLAGLVLGVLLAFIRELTDTTVKSPEFITDTLGLPVLGSIYAINDKDMQFGKARAKNAQPMRRVTRSNDGGAL